MSFYCSEYCEHNAEKVCECFPCQFVREMCGDGIRHGQGCALTEQATDVRDPIAGLDYMSDSSPVPDRPPGPGVAVHDDCGHPDWPDCPHYFLPNR